jgi:hypothetical protein|tara:strand:- start:2386 stop:3327 length:942 start_codon:yes stop_codon:yes gene_type:complete
MRDKHIITGGCSFTNCGKSWPYHIDQEKYGWVHNVATPGAGQAYITRSVIHQVENILNRNEGLPEDITVLVMWSGIDRFEILSTEKETPMHKLYIEGSDMNWLENFIFIDNGGRRIPFKESCWLKSSTRGMQWENKPVVRLFDMYFKFFHTEEESFVRSLENILRLQWYLESKNIKYKFMCWQNIFNKYSFTVPKGYPSENGIAEGHNIWCMGWSHNEWHDNIIWPKEIDCKISKDTPLLKDIYINSTHMWDMVDWDKWWFYEDDQVEYGGLAEWIILGERHAWGNGRDDPGHPSVYSHGEFTRKVIIPILGE